MNDSLNHKIFTETDCLSEQTMFDYIDKKLSEKENHLVEKHLLHCDLCSDALEGLEMVKDRTRIGAINQKALETISPPLVETKVVRINYKIILSVAATFLLLVGGVFFFNLLNQKSEVAEFKSEDATVMQEPPSPPTGTKTESKNDAVGGAAPVAPEETNTVTVEGKTIADPGVEPNTAPWPVVEEAQKMQDELKEGRAADAEVISANEELSRDAKVPASVFTKKEKVSAYKSDLAVADDESPQPLKDGDYEDVRKPNATYSGATYYQDKALNGSSLSQTSTTPAPRETKPVGGAQLLDSVTTEQIVESVAKTSNNKKRSAPKSTRKEEEELSDNVAYAPISVTKTYDEVVSLSAVEPAVESTDINPQYAGGQDSLISAIRNKFNPSLLVKYSLMAKQTTEVRFTIDKKGNLKNPVIVKGLNSELDKELLHVLTLLPKWTPGKTNGENASKEVKLSLKLSKE